MKTTTFLPLLLVFLTTSLFSQSNINQTLSINSTGAAADASAQLDVSATDKGMLVPRMTTAQRSAIAAPATGLLVFDTTTGGFWFYNGTAWTNLASPKILADADNDTKIQVEESPDEDIIRFDVAGVERMVLRQNINGIALIEVKNDNPNTVIGEGAGTNLNGGSEENVFLGVNAGATCTEVYDNTFIGSRAGAANTIGSYNTATGKSALAANTSGNSNTANGRLALLSNTTGNNNTAVGYQALKLNTIGNNNSAVGFGALAFNIGGDANVGVGVDALNKNTYGMWNVANGFAALFQNTTGSNNVATGFEALRNNTVGFSNVAVGKDALYNNTNRDNLVAIGDSALYNNGLNVMMNFEANYNTAVGSKALFSNTRGRVNTATGYKALFNSSTGNYNAAFGTEALRSNTTGAGNVAIGAVALFSNATGSDNTAVGISADVSSGALTNATVIGSDAAVNASNKVRIGNASVTVIEGQVAYTFPSDARFKFNIHDEGVPGLTFINQLRPVTYQFDTRKFDEHLMQNMPDSVQQRRMAGQDYSESTALVQTGFLAQEVEQMCKDLNFTFSGLHVPTSEVDNYGLAYGSFVPLLVKGMQEQQILIENGKLRMENLEAENAALKAELQGAKSQLDDLSRELGKITAALAGAGIAVEK